MIVTTTPDGSAYISASPLQARPLPIRDDINPSSLRYYPIQKRWQRVKRHLSDPVLKRILVRDFNKFTYGRWKIKFTDGMVPEQMETCMWQIGRLGRPPHYFRYVKHAACHWLVNFNLILATLSSDAPWRIVTSAKHSTVWDGKSTLFDLNFTALGVPPEVSWELASCERTQLAVGELLMVNHACHHKTERRTREKVGA